MASQPEAGKARERARRKKKKGSKQRRSLAAPEPTDEKWHSKKNARQRRKSRNLKKQNAQSFRRIRHNLGTEPVRRRRDERREAGRRHTVRSVTSPSLKSKRSV